MKTLADELLTDAIDMHCHCYPEFSLKAMKRMEDGEWTALAARVGMRGAVLKSHFWPTMTNVYYLKKQLPEEFRLFGSITLNLNCGGLEPYAVEAAASLGAKVVWMPTWSAQNDLQRKRVSKFLEGFFPSIGHVQSEGLRVLDADGRIIREVKEIIEICKEMDLVLSTGHLSVAESAELVREARAMGLKKMIFGHPDSKSVQATIEEMKAISSMGAYVESCYLGTLPLLQDKHPADMVKLIRAVGAERCILSTDAFFDWVPPEPEIMRMCIATLLALGITEQEIKMMVQRNPAALLGLE